MNCDSVPQNASLCKLQGAPPEKTSLPGAPSSARILRLRWGCATHPSQLLLLHVPFCPKRRIAPAWILLANPSRAVETRLKLTVYGFPSGLRIASCHCCENPRLCSSFAPSARELAHE